MNAVGCIMEDEVWEELVGRLKAVQRQLFSQRIPSLIILEGCSGRVIGRVSGDLLDKLEPRGVKYTHFDIEGISCANRLLSFLESTPANGQMAVYDRGWYSYIAENLEDVSEKGLHNHISEVNNFERYLSDNGIFLVKLFLKAEADEVERLADEFGPRHKKRSFLNDDHLSVKIYTSDRMRHFIEKTDTTYAKWSIVNIDNPELTAFNCISEITNTLEHKLQYNPIPSKGELKTIYDNPRKSVDLTLSAKKYNKKLRRYSKRLAELQSKLAISDHSLVVVFEGRDAAGKGGSIKRLARSFNPRGYVAKPIGVPTDDDDRHTYLWRFCEDLPCDGRITIFDRSWYGRMMVEPIEGLCTQEEYLRSADEINSFERMISHTGALVVKFWMELSKEEQLSRFNARLENPLKRWKITDEDWRNREKWEAYDEYVDRMIESTNTRYAPWYVVESEDKKYGRLKVLKTVIDTLEKALGK